jgi:hypothetical protein
MPMFQEWNYLRNNENLQYKKITIAQHAFGKIANFVVNSSLHFARNFILTERTRLRSSQPRQAPERYARAKSASI